MQDFASDLLAWFDLHGRKDLPWQQNITPYRVWISEIMLQQTQVATVIPYYEKFMKKFPSVEKLALADQEQVLHQWTGLGYYARARNLHKAARKVVRDYDGKVPLTTSALEALPGIGQSTAAAIVAICAGQRAAILDGNVKRVLARNFAIEGWPGQSQTLKQLWQKAQELTPIERVADYTQAIMDLGAIICTRNTPKCYVCPFEKQCYANVTQTVDRYPGKKPTKNTPTKTVTMLIIESSKGILLEKRPQSGIWGGLWSFPEVSEKKARPQLKRLGYKIIKSVLLPQIKHTFSHYHLDIKPLHLQVEPADALQETSTSRIWFNPSNPQPIGLSGVVTKILESR